MRLFDLVTQKLCLAIFRTADTIDGDGTRILVRTASIVVRLSGDGVSGMAAGGGCGLGVGVGAASFIELV
jgi:hypothetical protein